MSGAGVKVFEIATCPLCGGGNLAEIDLGGGSILRRCGTCFAVSAPAYADPADIYVDGYLFGSTDFGIDVRHPRFQDYLARIADRRLQIVERHTGGRGSLLDVGCGTGEVLAAGRARGWREQGVEPERTAAAMARERGVEVVVSPLEDSALETGSWDVVSAFHVLEHIPDPVAFLRMLARYARPGGHVVIEVPNFESRQRRLRGRDWVHLRPLEHISHLTPETLAAAFRGAGLEPVALRTPTWITPPQSLEEALRELARGRRCERLLEPLCAPYEGAEGAAHAPGRLAWTLLRAIGSAQDRLGQGTVVLGVARAPGGKEPTRGEGSGRRVAAQMGRGGAGLSL